MIAGKVIALTGASSGIGEATATYLARRGAKLVLGASPRRSRTRSISRMESTSERSCCGQRLSPEGHDACPRVGGLVQRRVRGSMSPQR